VQGTPMVRSRVKVLLAERNLERARNGEKPVSVRGLADQTGLTHSALVKLVNNKSTMISFSTLNSLCQALNCQPGDLLVYTPDETPPPSPPENS
jgi:putative transcriptional regulator